MKDTLLKYKFRDENVIKNIGDKLNKHYNRENYKIVDGIGVFVINANLGQ